MSLRSQLTSSVAHTFKLKGENTLLRERLEALTKNLLAVHEAVHQ